MKKNYIVLAIIGFMQLFSFAKADDTIFIKQSKTPILIERHDNPLFYIKLESNNGE